MSCRRRLWTFILWRRPCKMPLRPTHRGTLAESVLIYALTLGGVWASTPTLRFGLCGHALDQGGAAAEYYGKDIVGTYLAMDYFERGPTELGGGLRKPLSNIDFNIDIMPIITDCSSSVAFTRAVPVFMGGENSMPHVIVGCQCSQAAMSVARFSTAFGVPQVLTAADSSALSSTSEFPYVFRVCPADVIDADAHAKIIEHFGFKYVAVIYIDNPISINQKDRLLSHLAVWNVTASIVRFDDGLYGIEGGAVGMGLIGVRRARTEVAKLKAWVFACYFASEDDPAGNGIAMMSILYDAGVINGRTVMLFTDDQIARLQSTIFAPGDTFAASVKLSRSSINTSDEAIQYVEAIRTNLIGSFMVTELFAGPFEELKQWVSTSVQPSQMLSLGFSTSIYGDGANMTEDWFSPYSLPSEAAFRFDATMLVLLATRHLLEASTPSTIINRTKLFESIEELGRARSYAGVTGIVGWDESGDRTGLMYGILQIRDPTANEESNIAASFNEEIGHVTFKGDFTTTVIDSSLLASSPALGPDHYAPDCPGGHFKVSSFMPLSSCQPCSTGKYGNTGTNRCMDCIAGRYSSIEGSTTCDICAVGTMSFVNGANECSTCPAGRYAGSFGSTECTECSPGWVQGITGQSECTPCALGKFAEAANATACTSCALHETTTLRGSSSVEDCMCAPGYFQFEGRCQSCPTKMMCKGGNESPYVSKGFWASESNPYEAYLCVAASMCPGGKPGNLCTDGHSGFLCIECQEHYYRRWSRVACKPCTAFESFTFWTAVVFFLLMPLPAHYIIRKLGKLRQQSNIIFFSGLMGQLVTYAQLLSMVGSFQVSWPRIFVAMFNVISFFLLNAGLIAPQCSTGSWGFDEEYPIVMFMPLSFAFVYLLYYLGSCILKNAGLCSHRWEKDTMINALGRIFLIFHVSILKNSAKFFECYDHPNQRESSVIEYPNVLCWTSNHLKYLPFVIFALLVYCVGVFAVILRTVYRAPQRFGEPDFVRRYGFLMLKFRPDRWYWSVVIFTRNTVLAFIMACMPNFPVVQAVMFNIVLLSMFCLSAAYQPWMAPKNNLLELALTTLIIIFSLSAMPLAPRKDETVSQLAAVMVMASVLVAMLMIRILGEHLTKSFWHICKRGAHSTDEVLSPSIIPMADPSNNAKGGAKKEVGIQDVKSDEQLAKINAQIAQRLGHVIDRLSRQSEEEMLEMISTMNVYDKQVLGSFVRLISVAHLQENPGMGTPFFPQRATRPQPPKEPRNDTLDSSMAPDLKDAELLVAAVDD
mmetsp:Transcript_38068/g.104767  ORF Transcript_38068/g.104767 Transcript_38068/m.104767 type:complete len:1272 (+) Transcript_38068:107-3922(+)